MHHLHIKYFGCAVGLRIEATRERIAIQHRQAEITEPALRLRNITFHLVIEIKKALQALALDHEIIKRRQEMNVLLKLQLFHCVQLLQACDEETLAITFRA